MQLHKLRRSRTHMPRFRSVPRALLWPNPQVAVMLVFSGGIVESAMAILGAHAVGYTMPAWSITTAYATLLVISAFLASQLHALYRFYWSHREACWVKSDAPESYHEMGDPLLALLCRLRLIRPRSREQGSWILPEQDALEPQRTEQDLAMALDCGVGLRKHVAYCCLDRKHSRAAGDTLERLQLWTRDGAASAAGAAFSVIVITVQLLLAINTGLFYVHPWARTPSGQKIRLSINAVLQLGCALFTAGPAANDVLHGMQPLAEARDEEEQEEGGGGGELHSIDEVPRAT